MAGDFNKPVVTDAYASVLQSIKDLISDLAMGLDGTSTANIPTNAIRWSSANSRFEKYNGSTWAALASTFAMNVASVAGKIPGLAADNLLYLDGNAKVPLANLYTGSGSGLNADQVDGLDSTAFARRDYLSSQSMSDASAAVDTGVRFSYIGGTNKPTGTDHAMMTMAYSSILAVQLAGDWRTNEWYVRNENSGVWGAWARLVHSANAPGAMNAQAAGTYGGMNITGANNGWAGFQFNSSSRYFMSSSGQTGEYDTSADAWQWRWDNGTLAVGTIPWARLSGVPAMSFLGLGGGTMTGAIITTGNTEAFNSANETTLSIRSSGTGTAAAMSFNRLGSYAINMGLDTDNVFKIGGWSAGSPVFRLNMSGQLWLSNYGWLHDYFFNNVANCGNSIVVQGAGNVVSAQYHELVDNGGQIQIRQRQIMTNCNCKSNCNCTCFPAGSKVLMFDKSWRDIETIVIGELLMGADGKPAEVVKLDTPILGERQMYTFDDGHTWSEEHLHWIRRDGAEWWWSANPDQWRYEVQVGEVAGLRDNMSVRSGEDVEFAHLEGFVKRTPTRVQYDPSTPLFLPVTRGIPIIVDGYVVAASADEFSYDYSQFNWNPREIV